MSLVAYGNSDSEEECEDQDEVVSSSTTTSASIPSKSSKTSITDELVSSSSSTGTKRTGEKIKISIPSLKEFEEDEKKPEPKKKLTYKGGVGLFSILPPPKHSGPSSTTSFKPHILTKAKATKPLPPKTVKPHAVQSSATEQDPDSSDDFNLDPVFSNDPDPVSENKKDENASDSTSGLGSFFFTLPEPVSNSYVLPEEEEVLPVKPVQDFYSSSSQEMPMEQDFPSTSSFTVPEVHESSGPSGSNIVHQPSGSEDQESLLNDEEFRKILGKRGREEINFIDVRGEDQITGKDQWLMRSLTEERLERPSKRRHGLPTQQQKRKHQITYLAHQAKERELDLKNQWSSNSLTRRETQAKYGF